MKTLCPECSGLLISAALILALSACGGSSGGPDDELAAGTDGGAAGFVIDDGAAELPPEQSLQDDQPANTVETSIPDIADLLVTEIDRQWSCDITSDQASSFSTLFFSRRGTVLFGENDLRFWNRNLPLDQVNIASPTSVFSVISDIQNFNTLLSFTLTTEVGGTQTYDCVLTTREITS